MKYLPNSSNKLEDVNTIKQFCDAVNANLGGDAAVVACRLLAHKIQSPQDREALQSLAVLEAGVKSCGPVFHAEVGKFKFLNEMIKLVSPKYLVSTYILKVRQSRKQIMVSSNLPKNERWDNFQVSVHETILAFVFWEN